MRSTIAHLAAHPAAFDAGRLDCALSTSMMQAVAGADHNISLISIVEARVVSLFKGDAQTRDSYV